MKLSATHHLGHTDVEELPAIRNIYREEEAAPTQQQRVPEEMLQFPQVHDEEEVVGPTRIEEILVQVPVTEEEQ
ncbi:hypothetical protein Pmani_011511 [Petrolisthes manimaculis]|uniref:Uncharacterized protein n=1 Tax=Petrolisthes manimaculis TaxID=1843537 RepID=A0AAE1Q0Z3_9EUCA|nr:hypothetical protein Pmani_011511 [Petrolisthes manimaculis]